eukprot:195418_1
MSLKTCLIIVILFIFCLQSYLSLNYEISDIADAQTLQTTPSPTPHYTNIPAIKIENNFIDDFLCDPNHGIIGWSNCNHINNKYHGPFNNLNNSGNSNTLFREFQCMDTDSIAALISFSIVFDCNVAFTDQVSLYINNNLISTYNSATQEDILIDNLLFPYTSNTDCKWYINKNITYTMPIINSYESFQLKFETFLYQVNVIKNIVIFDININCVSPNNTNIVPIETESTNVIIRDDMLKCKKYYKN